MANKDREQQADRDTHFAGFAKLLFDKLWATSEVWADTGEPYWKEEWQEVIARHAYDLVAHTIENTAHIDLDRLSTEEHVLRIPDLTELPEEAI